MSSWVKAWGRTGIHGVYMYTHAHGHMGTQAHIQVYVLSVESHDFRRWESWEGSCNVSDSCEPDCVTSVASHCNLLLLCCFHVGKELLSLVQSTSIPLNPDQIVWRSSKGLSRLCALHFATSKLISKCNFPFVFLQHYHTMYIEYHVTRWNNILYQNEGRVNIVLLVWTSSELNSLRFSLLYSFDNDCERYTLVAIFLHGFWVSSSPCVWYNEGNRIHVVRTQHTNDDNIAHH